MATVDRTDIGDLYAKTIGSLRKENSQQRGSYQRPSETRILKSCNLSTLFCRIIPRSKMIRVLQYFATARLCIRNPETFSKSRTYFFRMKALQKCNSDILDIKFIFSLFLRKDIHNRSF